METNSIFLNLLTFLSLLTLVPQVLSAVRANDDYLHPIILVPGYATNQLEARLTDTYFTTNPNCTDHIDGKWFRLWKNTTVLDDPFLTSCFAEQMSLFFDPTADDFHNAPGVETRAPYFGSTYGFRFTDPDHDSDYMATLVRNLETMGYKEGNNMFGAPYDFRYGLAGGGHPSHVGSTFLGDMKLLVERASLSKGNRSVIFLTHSYGGMLTLQFLNRNTLSWRKRFVEHFIALSAPWGGTVAELMSMVSGASLGMKKVNPFLLRREIRSLESSLWFLPSPKYFGSSPLLVTPQRVYSAFDTSKFLVDIGSPEDVGPYETRIKPLIGRLDWPGVKVTSIVGVGVKTAEVVVCGDGFDGECEIGYGDGDGVVNSKNLLALEKEWSYYEEEQRFRVIKIPNVDHGSIVLEEVPLRIIMREISDVNSLPVMSSIASE